MGASRLEYVRRMLDGGEVKRASIELEKLAQTPGQEAELQFLQGVCAFRRNDFRSALSHFKSALADEQTPDASYYSGLACRATRRWPARGAVLQDHPGTRSDPSTCGAKARKSIGGLGRRCFWRLATLYRQFSSPD